jgi:hypothetical protein
MNPIIIPKSFINKSLEFYYNYIISHPVTFKIRKANVDSIIKQIEKTTKNYTDYIFVVENFLFFLFRYSYFNDITSPLIDTDGGRPKDGVEFKDKNTAEGYSIFHCHLSNINNSILIWYPCISINKKQYIHIEYMLHPKIDEYIELIQNIYKRNDNGYHIYLFEYFNNLQYIILNTTIDENNNFIIKKYNIFIKRYKI